MGPDACMHLWELDRSTGTARIGGWCPRCGERRHFPNVMPADDRSHGSRLAGRYQAYSGLETRDAE